MDIAMLKQYSSGIYGFIHIGVLGRWKKIFNSQVDLLNKSGLMQKTNKIFVGIAGDYTQVELPASFSLCSIDPILQNGENKTLMTMYAISHYMNDSKIWYIHTKGARHKDDKSFSAMCGDSWRDYMQYYIIEKHEDCIAALDNCDVAGVEWRKDFFAGNFWWANSSYIKTIREPLTGVNPLKNGLGERFLAEFHFICKENPIVHNFQSVGELNLDGKFLQRVNDHFEIKMVKLL